MNRIKSTSKKIAVALAVASAMGGAVMMSVAAPAGAAQAKEKEAKAEKEKPKGSLSRPFSKPVEEAQKLFKESKFQDALNVLNEADTKSGKSPYDQFVLDELRSFSYRNLQNYADAAALAEKGLSSGFLDGQDLAVRPKLLATLYYQVKNYDKAVEFGAKGLETEPNDPTLFQIVSQGYYLKNDFPGTVKFIDSYVTKQESAGTEPSEQSLLLLRSACVKQDDNACTSRSTDRLVAHHPKAEYWQQAVDPLMRTKTSDAVLFNVYRLALAVGTMQKSEDYFEFVDLALRAGSPGEAQNALDDGKAKGVFGDAKSQERLKTVQASVTEQVKTDQASLEKIAKDADASKVGQKDIGVGIAYLGYKQYDKAIESFKKGLGKSGVMNVPEANLLLGISALRAGKKDEAQTAFKSVKGDAQLERIATLWSLHAAKA